MAEVKVKAGVDPKLEKIFFMRELTRRTGILQEPQVMNLQTWPLIYTNALKVDCHFSFDEKIVKYDFVAVGPKLDDMDKRYRHLELSVKMLLGDEYLIEIHCKNKQLYPETNDGNKLNEAPRPTKRARKGSVKKVVGKA